MNTSTSPNMDTNGLGTSTQSQTPDVQVTEAIQSCIEVWESYARDPEAAVVKFSKQHQCALCKMFYDCGCGKCPIAEKTGEPVCKGTPFDAWKRLTFDYRFAEGMFKPSLATLQKAAQDEVDFLKSLLPDPQAETSNS